MRYKLHTRVLSCMLGSSRLKACGSASYLSASLSVVASLTASCLDL
jgi:hypothetical protein